ncbi:shikimate dehydrogenase [Cloacibacterium sp.]|uniref:shikimate dehydrogenase family protein n=1 Tax=Cloacibacterium sp. TaxID=1913682 RepID=UPI0035B3EBEC
METSAKFGLIGKKISYSFSKKYFEQKFQKLLLNDHSYNIIDLENLDNIKNIFETEHLKGLNVTIPYKEKIIPFIDELSDEAKEIGAINCISVENGKTKGYNTDAFGFEKTLLLHKKEHQKTAIILGNGGAAKAVQYVLKKNQIPYITVSRTTEINYENLSENLVKENLIIIQCTPVGTFPNIEDSVPFPFDGITKNHLIIDLIYNPEYTKFIRNCAEKGAKTANGLYMLEQQAEKAWEIWNS